MEGGMISGANNGFYVDIYHAWPPLALFLHDKYPDMRHLRGVDTENDAISQIYWIIGHIILVKDEQG